MRKTLTALLTGAAIVLTGTAAHAGTTPSPSPTVDPSPTADPIAGVTGLPPVLTGPVAKVKGFKPVLSGPKHRRVAAAHITALPRTGGLYTAGLEGGAGLLVVGGVLIAVGRKHPKIAA